MSEPATDASLSSEPGTYALVIREPESGHIRVGSLGILECEGRWLVYVGSALGPGGLSARVRHHLSRKGSPHWHIDYLLDEARVVEVWCRRGDRRLEEAWAATLRSASEATVALTGFGSSDCRCDGHLVAFSHRPRLDRFRARLRLAGGPTDGLAAVPARRLG